MNFNATSLFTVLSSSCVGQRWKKVSTDITQVEVQVITLVKVAEYRP